MTLPTYLSGGRIQGKTTDTSGEPDTLGSSADGTLIGDPTGGDTSPTPPTGLGTSSFVFDGNDGITIDGAEPFSTTVGSISLWFYNDGTSNDKGVLFFGDTDASSYLGIETKTDGIWAKFRQASGTTSQWEWRSSNNSVTLTDAWHHLVISQDGTAVKIYVDAVELTTFDASTDKSKWMESNLDNGRIGCNSISGNGNANFLTGNLMEVAMWNVALTQAQVTSLYNSGTGRLANTEPTGLKAYYPLSGSVVTNAAVVVDKSKASITDVPAGTRYEETDTRKIFRWKDESTVEVEDSDGYGTIITSSATSNQKAHDFGSAILGDFTFRTTMNCSMGNTGQNGGVAMFLSTNDANYQGEAHDSVVGALGHKHNASNSRGYAWGQGDNTHNSSALNNAADAIWEAQDVGDYACDTPTYGLDIQGNTKNYEIERSGTTLTFKIFSSGWSSPDSTRTVTGAATTKYRYVYFAGRWQGDMTATNSYWKVSYTVAEQWVEKGTA